MKKAAVWGASPQWGSPPERHRFKRRWRGAKPLVAEGKFGLMALLMFSLVSCSSPDPALFTLQPVPGTARSTAVQVIELRRPGLAGYLDRPDIVLRDAGYQLSVNSQQRWAEPIGDMIGRVLTQDLSQRLPSNTVFSESGAITADPTLRIELDIVRFDQGADGRLTLVAEAAIEAGRSHAPLRTRHVVLQADPGGAKTADLVAGMSGLLGQLADRLAQDIAEQKEAVLF